MRKIISRNVVFILLLCLISSMSLPSCSDDEDRVDGRELIGNWSYSGKKEVTSNILGVSAEIKEKIEGYVKNSYQAALSENHTYLIKEGGGFSIIRDQDILTDNLEYTYSKEDGILKIFSLDDEEASIAFEIVSISANNAVLKYTYDLNTIHWDNDIEIDVKTTKATALLYLTRTNNK